MIGHVVDGESHLEEEGEDGGGRLLAVQVPMLDRTQEGRRVKRLAVRGEEQRPL